MQQLIEGGFLERWANPIASAIVLTVGVVFVGGLLTGCAAAPAAKPICEKWRAQVVHDDEGNIAGIQLTMPQVEGLHDVMRALSDGRCRLPGPGEGGSL